MLNRLSALQERCRTRCEQSGRDPSSVRLVAVSKGQSLEKIKEAYSLGVRDFGENYANQMAQKMQALAQDCPEIRWHYIGHIQSNKIKLIAAAHWIHSLCELRHAQAIAALHNRVLLQVNLGSAENRSGVNVSQAQERFSQLHALLGDRLCGLMTIAPVEPGVEPKFWFAQMKSLKERIEGELSFSLPELSMGMSGDFEDAISMGATWIRVGTLLFGEREGAHKH